jgi:hypothetical protein
LAWRVWKLDVLLFDLWLRVARSNSNFGSGKDSSGALFVGIQADALLQPWISWRENRLYNFEKLCGWSYNGLFFRFPALALSCIWRDVYRWLITRRWLGLRIGPNGSSG